MQRIDSFDFDESPAYHQNHLPKKWKASITVLSILVLLFFISTITVSVILVHTVDKIPPEKEAAKPTKNVILMISDGFGPASETFARTCNQYMTKNLTYGNVLPLDDILVGLSRTLSTDSLVTDSAAGATAFSCGIKTYNGGIAVDPTGEPCPTVLEAARAKGMKTGLVATSRITHATPAAFASHVASRENENDIALQEVHHVVDVLLGGGWRQFIPQSEKGSARTDDIDVLEYARTLGYRVILDRQSFDETPENANSLPLLGLFSKSHMSYEIDRNPEKEPSLAEMSQKALNLLLDATRDRNEGFFIMIEGSRIDHAAHENDPVAHLHDILAYNEAIRVAREFVDQNPETLLISVSDHECGGLTLGGIASTGAYYWDPQFIINAQTSSATLGANLKKLKINSGLPAAVATTFNLSFNFNLTGIELQSLVSLLSSSDSTEEQVSLQVANIISARSAIKWGTLGHTEVDVSLYAYGQDSELLQGNHENTDIGLVIIETLNLDMSSVNLNNVRMEPLPRELKKAHLVDEWHFLGGEH